ncbi:MAG TPA: hypothetical protein VM694_14720 [Polyangium sp.]|nr:hypothetical protein [Polyangium sp.]
MTRRKKLIAAALSLPLALALGVGLTVRRAGSDTLSADVCDKDLAAVFDYCESGGEVCTKPHEGMEEACQAGCVMRMCPNHVACTELDPIWCRPCEDEAGALHWSILLDISRQCESSPDPSSWKHADWKAYSDCLIAEGERRCPALANKPYWHRPPHARNPRWGHEECYDDFNRVVSGCERDPVCALETGVAKEACEAGCLLTMCPDQVACTGDDPIRCAPCEDARGALYWRHFLGAGARCDASVQPWTGLKPEQDRWAACFVADMEQHCPALAGTEWWRRRPFLVEHYGIARPPTAPPASPDTP